MKKWKRSLGTSKREQGVLTPPAPQHKKRRLEFFIGGPACGIKTKTHGVVWVSPSNLEALLARLRKMGVSHHVKDNR